MEWKILRTSFYGWGIKNLRLLVYIYIYIYTYIAQNDERVAKKQLIISDEELKKNLSDSIIV